MRRLVCQLLGHVGGFGIRWIADFEVVVLCDFCHDEIDILIGVIR